jgi:hypothetical protein
MKIIGVMGWMEDVNVPYKYGRDENRETVLCSHWLLYFTLLLLPIVNIAMLLVWALKGKNDIYSASLVTFARAMLIFIAMLAIVGTGVYFLFRHLEGQMEI